MPTFQELGERYAQWLAAAKVEDRRRTREVQYITESVAKQSELGSTLKRISRDIAQYRIGGQELSDEQKREILEITRRRLNLRPTVNVFVLVQEASIDDFTNLADLWDEFFDKLDE